LQNRQAGADSAALLGAALRSQEGFFERFDDFCDQFSKIEKAFQNRLSGKVIRFGEDYIDNSFGIIAHLHRRGQPESEWLALCVDCCTGLKDNPATIATSENKFAIESNDMGCGEQEPVFVDVVDLVQVPDHRGMVVSFVRLYVIKNKSPSLWEGLLYRRLVATETVQGAQKILPRFVSWESYLASQVGLAGSCQTRPEKIHNAVEAVNGITEVEYKRDWDVLLGSDTDHRATGLQIILYDDHARIVGNDSLDERFDAVDVLFGPFNLKF
jgi:hypothetical protein